MLHLITLLLYFCATLWSVGLARSIPCDTDAKADTVDDPILELPWGKYLGKHTDSSKNVTVFKNVRYGKAPVGDLRFKASVFPDAGGNEKQNFNSPGPICMQAGTKGPDGKIPPAKPEETEDCLFLDIYVPTKAFKKDEPPFPVNVYLYGGAFIFGFKDTTVSLGSQTLNLYDGKSLLDRSEHEFIWVVGNYRVGAYGWLAGESVEAGGTPNAGLHDQKLILDFVKKYIDKVNGYAEGITLWGNSAGASSIMYHLTAGEDGRQGPDFDKAVLFSPASQWFVDRKGQLEDTFKTLAKKAGCTTPSLDCLRNADASKLRQANQDIVTDSLANGFFPFGPSIDGTYVRQIANARLNNPYYDHKYLKSIVVSHVRDEAGLFLPQLSWVDSEENFQKFLNLSFPGNGLAEVREAISDVYTVPEKLDNQTAQRLRVREVVRDSTLLCNSHASINSQVNSYAMQFNFPPALHGSDLLPLTWNKDIDTGRLIDGILGNAVNETTKKVIQTTLASFSKTYQSYFATYAVYGVPFPLDENDPPWEKTGRLFGDIITKVLNVGIGLDLKPSFQPEPDVLLRVAACSVWSNIASYINDGINPGFTSSFQGKSSLRAQPGSMTEQQTHRFSSWEL